MSETAQWRRAAEADLDTIVAIQNRVHTIAGESRAVFASKHDVFPQGAWVLAQAGATIGYGVFHPWMLDDIPTLHALPFRAPAAPDCVFIHDVALLPEARRRGAGGALAELARAEARRMGLRWLALVSVYDTVAIWSRSGFAVRATPSASAAAFAAYGDTARYMGAEVV